MKKVLFLSNGSGKVTNFSLPAIEAAQALGYEFHMAADYSKSLYNSAQYGVIPHHVDMERNPFSPKNLRAYQQVRELLSREQFAMIHCNSPIGGVVGRLCGSRAKVPIIMYTVHGFHFFHGAPLLNRTIYRCAEQMMATMTDVIITINKEDYLAAQQMKLRRDGMVLYIPGVGVDVEAIRQIEVDVSLKRKELGLGSQDFVVIAVGRLEKNKNVLTMIRALKNTDQSVKLVLCGKGPQRESLEKEAVKLGLSHQVVFAGFRQDVPHLLRASNAFLLTSFREGLPRSLMEAMAAGLPCIASDIRGVVDLIEDGKGGYLVHPNDSSGVGVALESLRMNPMMCRTMGRVNQATVEGFSLDVVRTEMRTIYKQVLQSA